MGHEVHVMVDLETLDVQPSATILSIGACVISHLPQPERFYVEVDVDTQYMRTRSQSTMDWWAQQKTPMPIGTIPLHSALTSFEQWLQSLNATPIIWCKGTDFDISILNHAYRSLYIPVPWKYSNVRDLRTVFKLANHKPAYEVQHIAVQDALCQAEDLLAVLHKMGLVLA